MGFRHYGSTDLFCLDIETAGSSEKSVILSAAIVYFDETQKYTLEQLLQDCCFVKFNAKEQIKKYNRVVEPETIEWWNKQTKFAKDASLKPLDSDIYTEAGLEILRKYITEKTKQKEEIVWTRGSLDQFCIDSLCKDAKQELLFKYSVYRDIRTAIDLLKETAKGGYCEVPGLDKNKIFKHIPTYDVCYDILMLLEGV